MSDAPADIPPSAPIEEGRIRSGKLAGMSMWHAIIVLSWPVLIESFGAALVGMVDTTLSAGISRAATDAVGAAAYFGWIIGLLGIALGIGATALISRAMGRGRTAVAGAAVGQCVLLSVTGGVLIGLAIAAIAPWVASLMSLSDEAREAAIIYLRITAIGVPANTILAAGIAACRGAGDSVVPLIVMISVNIINTIGSVVLSGVDIATSKLGPDGEVIRRVIWTNPVELNWGVAGIAWGTTIGWSVGAIILLVALARGVHGLKLRASRLKPHWHTIQRLNRVGIPNLIETFGMWFGNFIAILMVGWMHNEGYIGTHIVAARIEAFSYLPGFAMGAAAATLAGQYLGAGSPRLARLAVWRCLIIACVIMSIGSVAFVAIPSQITGLFTQQRIHLELTPKLLLIAAIIQIPFAISIVVRGAMRGAGDTKGVLRITWLSTWGIRLPLAWLFCGVDIPLPGGGHIPNPAPLQEWWGVHPLVGFWIGLCGEIIIRAMMYMACFAQDGWLKAKV